MCQIGLVTLALAPADGPGGQFGTHLDGATGAWLYMVDHMLRTETAGGFSPGGWLCGLDSPGSMVHFTLALYTAFAQDSQDVYPLSSGTRGHKWSP